MPTVDIVCRQSNWEGYTTRVSGFYSEAKALEFVARLTNAGSSLHKIFVRQDNAPKPTLAEVKTFLTAVADHERSFPDNLYTANWDKLGTRRFDHVDRDENTAKGSTAWLVFEHEGVTYKWSGTHGSSGYITWDSVDKLVEVTRNESVATVKTVTWA